MTTQSHLVRHGRHRLERLGDVDVTVIRRHWPRYGPPRPGLDDALGLIPVTSHPAGGHTCAARSGPRRTPHSDSSLGSSGQPDGPPRSPRHRATPVEADHTPVRGRGVQHVRARPPRRRDVVGELVVSKLPNPRCGTPPLPWATDDQDCGLLLGPPGRWKSLTSPLAEQVRDEPRSCPGGGASVRSAWRCVSRSACSTVREGSRRRWADRPRRRSEDLR